MIDLNSRYSRDLLFTIDKFLPIDLDILQTLKDVPISNKFKCIQKAHILAEVPSLELSVIEIEIPALQIQEYN